MLYLLDREYLGLPAGLGPTTPGFLAESQPAPTSSSGGAGQGGEYVFNDAVVLEGGRQYWFYTSAQGAFAHVRSRSLCRGQMYNTGIETQPFRRTPASGRMVNGVFVPAPPGVFIDANFRLRAAVQWRASRSKPPMSRESSTGI